MRLRNGEFRNGASAPRANPRGRPDKSGSIGQPNSRSGGATIVSNKCCAMWSISNQLAKASSGEASATKMTASPARKEISRSTGNRRGIWTFNFRQPRR